MRSLIHGLAACRTRVGTVTQGTNDVNWSRSFVNHDLGAERGRPLPGVPGASAQEPKPAPTIRISPADFFPRELARLEPHLGMEAGLVSLDPRFDGTATFRMTLGEGERDGSREYRHEGQLRSPPLGLHLGPGGRAPGQADV